MLQKKTIITFVSVAKEKILFWVNKVTKRIWPSVYKVVALGFKLRHKQSPLRVLDCIYGLCVHALRSAGVPLVCDSSKRTERCGGWLLAELQWAVGIGVQ